MTTRIGIATFAAVSSAVLTFGNTAHAEGHPFLNYSASISSYSELQVTEPTYEYDGSAEIPSPIQPQKPLPIKSEPKIDQLQEIAAIATEAKGAASGGYRMVSDGRNTYAWGQCTWYAKNKRPDLPNALGNGGQWVARAAALGYATGSTPRAGAIGEEPGHVVYVESVNGDGSVNISEMNYNGGVGVVHTRTTSASEFRYIY